jgi:uncharacterized membrane protein
MEPVGQTPDRVGADDNGKTVALLSYLTIIGWVIAFVMNGSQKTTLGAYHLRQTLFLFIIGLCLYIVQLFLLFIPFIGWIVSLLLIFGGIGLFILWIIGLIAAVNGEQKPMPLIGNKAQEIFKGLGNA